MEALPSESGLTLACIGILAVAALSACSTQENRRTGVAENSGSLEAISFQTQIKPLLQERCLPCHNGHKAAGDLDLRNRQLTFRPSPNGPFIVPGHPDRSKIFRMIELTDTQPGAMPPTGHRLSEAQIALLKGWIAQGASWPEGEAGELQPTSTMDWRSR